MQHKQTHVFLSAISPYSGFNRLNRDFVGISEFFQFLIHSAWNFHFNFSHVITSGKRTFADYFYFGKNQVVIYYTNGEAVRN